MTEITGGKIKKKLIEETEIEWEIRDFLSFIDNFYIYKSPDFHFANDSWYLKMYKDSCLDSKFLALYLNCNKERKYSVEYNFSLKKQDGSAEYFIRNVMPGNKKFSEQASSKFIKRSDVVKRKEELLPSGQFTILCKLQNITAPSTEPMMPDKQKLEMLKKLETLSDNFKNLFVNKPSCDVTLHVMDKEYKAHRAVLIARSSVFAAMFEHETSEKQTGIINITDCDPDSFAEFLEFLYCGKLHKLSSSSAVHLYETSNKYDVQELKTFCMESLTKNLSMENVCDVVILADKYDEAELMSAAQDVFNESLHEIVESSEWESLVKNNYRLSKKILKGIPLKKGKT